MVTLISQSLGLVVHLSLPILLAALAGVIVVGILGAATQIQDSALSFPGKLVGVALTFYLGASYFITEVSNFATRYWGGVDMYH
ncbi:hypothetical protein BVY03_00240 [bacterium K02(2017)]|nr:hypothetical protein BVY03_00240 [bacterium K02(2017)]